MSSPVQRDLDQLCDALAVFEQRRDEAQTAMDNAKNLIMEQLRQAGVKSSTTRSGRKVTIVEGTRTSWKQDVLADILGPNLWEEVTKRVLDPDRLESVVEREKIQPATLQDALVETTVKAYPKITAPRKKG